MARTDHLPIYKAAYDLCLYLERTVRKFPRYHCYMLGTDLREGARRVLTSIVRANARRDKAPPSAVSTSGGRVGTSVSHHSLQGCRLLHQSRSTRPALRIWLLEASVTEHGVR